MATRKEKTAELKSIAEPLVFERVDPAKLAAFDPATKYCHMNCGPHRDDPRDRKERKFLCGDCIDSQAVN